jgi:hypothetical protein
MRKSAADLDDAKSASQFSVVVGDEVVLRRIIAPPKRMMMPNAMTTTHFEFIIKELITGSY